jgi:hypothetical protein
MSTVQYDYIIVIAHVDGMTLRLWTAATNVPSLQLPDDI